MEQRVGENDKEVRNAVKRLQRGVLLGLCALCLGLCGCSVGSLNVNPVPVGQRLSAGEAFFASDPLNNMSGYSPYETPESEIPFPDSAPFPDAPPGPTLAPGVSI